MRSLLALTADGAALPVSVAVCDGDTPQHERARIQYAAEIGAPNIILTNPDMLHCTLLPDVSRLDLDYNICCFYHLSVLSLISASELEANIRKYQVCCGG